MTTGLKVNGKASRRIPIRWESVDADWKPVGIRLHSCSYGQSMVLGRVWQYICATIGFKQAELGPNDGRFV